MNKKSQIALALAFVGMGLAWQAPVGAMELWDAHLPGVNEGMVAGALPPPGVYGVWDQYWASFNIYDNAGNATGNTLDALVEIPIVLWNPGVKVFGADYSAALALPFDYTNLKVPGLAATSANAHWGMYNTIIDPVLLHWALPHDFHIKTGLGVVLDDATSSPAKPPSGGGVGAGNGYASIQPMLGVSWLHDGWNLSADAQYSFNATDTTTHYRSGQELSVDYTVTKTRGPWTYGVGAYSLNQLTADSGSGASACAAAGGCKVVNYGLGPLVGYQIGKLDVMAEYNRSVRVRNDVGGNILNIRFILPIG